MSRDLYQVIGIGNAIVDVVIEISLEDLEKENFEKGKMILVDESVAKSLFGKYQPKIQCSGGSAANTIAGIAALGGNVSFIGKVRNDDLGSGFESDIRSLGVKFNTEMATAGPATATCIVFVTPDAERTMVTYLGACLELTPDDIDKVGISESLVTYIEGYLWDPPDAKDALIKAANIAHDSGRLVAFSLSDPFCVARHRDEFKSLLLKHIDILFANEDEIISLFESKTFEQALLSVEKRCKLAVITRGSKGAVIINAGKTMKIDSCIVQDVVDTTGAGDAFAAGFLYGFTNNLSLEDAGRIGAICAADIITFYGARPKPTISKKVELFMK